MKPLPAPTPSSIVSFPERGPWGSSRYPGNSSGYILLELLATLKPRFVIDVTAGSGTNVELCNDFGIRVLGLDLKDGFNALKESVLGRAGEPADLTWSHPPYWDVKKYSSHPDDLCACANEDEFLGKLHVLLLNQREATDTSRQPLRHPDRRPAQRRPLQLLPGRLHHPNATRRTQERRH